jgi:hypothetical protein
MIGGGLQRTPSPTKKKPVAKPVKPESAITRKKSELVITAGVAQSPKASAPKTSLTTPAKKVADATTGEGIAKKRSEVVVTGNVANSPVRSQKKTAELKPTPAKSSAAEKAFQQIAAKADGGYQKTATAAAVQRKASRAAEEVAARQQKTPLKQSVAMPARATSMSAGDDEVVDAPVPKPDKACCVIA